MSFTPHSLELSIIIYTKEATDNLPAYPGDHHAALVIGPSMDGISRKYHAIEDAENEGDMKFQHIFKGLSDYRNTMRAHHTIN